MNINQSVHFFDTQFQEQVRNQQFQLNPFELAVLPHLHGRVLDFGCGMGNLAFAAARKGCSVLALDASPTAISHIKRRAVQEQVAVKAQVADLRDFKVREEFDAVVSIGLLMFFDCATALGILSDLKSKVAPGGIAAFNVLVEGTTYMDMFDPQGHCLFARRGIESGFSDWSILSSVFQDFDAPNATRKCFSTVIARKPEAI